MDGLDGCQSGNRCVCTDVVSMAPVDATRKGLTRKAPKCLCNNTDGVYIKGRSNHLFP